MATRANDVAEHAGAHALAVDDRQDVHQLRELAGNLLRLQQTLQLLRVRRRLRHASTATVRARGVVVEERVGLLGLLRELAQRRNPLAQLLVRVEIVEPVRRGAATLVPRPRVAAVKADVSVGLVSAGTVGTRFFAPSIRGASTITFAAPSSSRNRSVSSRWSSSNQRAVPELHEHLVVPELLARPFAGSRATGPCRPRTRKLEEDAAELAAGAQRLERGEEPAEDLAAKLPRRPLDPSALVGRRVVPQVRRQRLELDGMTRHQAERLDVHHEPVRRALRPALDHLFVRQPVIGRVDLDRVEVLGVVRQTVSGLRARRIPVLRERVVGPGAGADADFRHRRQHTRRGPAGPVSYFSCARFPP